MFYWVSLIAFSSYFLSYFSTIIVNISCQLLLKIFLKTLNYRGPFIIYFIIGVGAKERLF